MSAARAAASRAGGRHGGSPPSPPSPRCAATRRAGARDTAPECGRPARSGWPRPSWSARRPGSPPRAARSARRRYRALAPGTPWPAAVCRRSRSRSGGAGKREWWPASLRRSRRQSGQVSASWSNPQQSGERPPDYRRPGSGVVALAQMRSPRSVRVTVDSLPCAPAPTMAAMPSTTLLRSRVFDGLTDAERERSVPRPRSPVTFGRRCIPGRGVARRLHTPGMRPPRALRAGRIAALGVNRTSGTRVLAGLRHDDDLQAGPGPRASGRSGATLLPGRIGLSEDPAAH